MPGLIALAVISASFSNLLTDLVAQRDSGRPQATPRHSRSRLRADRRPHSHRGRDLARNRRFCSCSSAATSTTSAIPNHALPAVAITILFGSVTFSALAYALAPSIRSSTAIQPVIQLILLPLYAISGVLLPNSKNPDWLNQIASVLPLQHLAHGLHHAFDPTTHGIGLSIVDLAVLSAWSIAALVLATQRFTWLPASG